MFSFDSLVLLLFGGNNPELKKKKALKDIGRQISQSRYHKFYKVRSDEITPQLGAFFYDIYRITFPVHVLLKNAAKSVILKQLIVEAFLTEELEEIYARLSSEFIEEQAKTASIQDLNAQLEEDLQNFSSALSKKMYVIDRCYSLIIAFSDFVSFDFFSLLKKIDSRMQEQNLIYQPQFRHMNGKYLIENIKDFLDIIPFDTNPDEWKTVFEILNKYRGDKNIIDPNQWKKLISTLQDVHRSDILTFIVRHIEQNPKWQRNLQVTNEYIVDSYITFKRAEVQSCIDKIAEDKLVTKRDALAKKLFRNTNVSRLKYYTYAGNDVYLKKNLGGFTYIMALNYVQAFLIDYDNVQGLCDVFLIQGKWRSQELSWPLSQQLHEITTISDQLTEFDESLSEKGAYGNKLKLYINKYNIDKQQITNIKVTLSTINNKAKEMVKRMFDCFLLIESYLKDLGDDYKKSEPALLVNWKEVEAILEHPITEQIEQVCELIEDFMFLLRLFISEDA